MSVMRSTVVSRFVFFPVMTRMMFVFMPRPRSFPIPVVMPVFMFMMSVPIL